MAAAHTEGPWRWEINRKHRSLHLVGGRPQFDLTVLDFARWGTQGATMRLRDTAHDGMNIMHRLHERADWIAPFPVRGHHADWCSAVVHPDALLIQAAPTMLAALRRAAMALAFAAETSAAMHDDYEVVSQAIAEATGAAS